MIAAVITRHPGALTCAFQSCAPVRVAGVELLEVREICEDATSKLALVAGNPDRIGHRRSPAEMTVRTSAVAVTRLRRLCTVSV